MSSLSTHVLDTSLGLPAAGVPVTVEQEANGEWHAIASHTTDNDGRVKQLAASLGAGTYRISFATQVYFEAQNIAGLYPRVQITFLVRDQAAHYHIPLLLSANGYSTYRGS
jgi:5-hydroxyisourate hydrolase